MPAEYTFLEQVKSCGSVSCLINTEPLEPSQLIASESEKKHTPMSNSTLQVQWNTGILFITVSCLPRITLLYMYLTMTNFLSCWILDLFVYETSSIQPQKQSAHWPVDVTSQAVPCWLGSWLKRNFWPVLIRLTQVYFPLTRLYVTWVSGIKTLD